MPSRAQRERSERRRALRLLAGEPEGVIEAMMLAHGFRVELLVDLCIAGLATAKPEQMHAGGRTMESEDRVASEAYKPSISVANKRVEHQQAHSQLVMRLMDFGIRNKTCHSML
jgi:hypothetical protein